MYNEDILLGGWKRIGVGFDWGCPLEDARGVVLVVLFAGRDQGTLGCVIPNTTATWPPPPPRPPTWPPVQTAGTRCGSASAAARRRRGSTAIAMAEGDGCSQRYRPVVEG